jgi:thymidylate synthase
MFIVASEGINSCLVELAKLLLEKGIERKTRKETCRELPAPVMIQISNPLSRWITLPERKWDLHLPYAESLWLALGQNDLGLIKYYLPKMEKFSDDGKFVRGGYGPRLRHFNGNAIDYKQDGHQRNPIFKKQQIDQFRYIVDCFKRDPWTRQAIIIIGDPSKDCFNIAGNIKQTKDFPCTTSLHFIQNPIENKLNLTVYMRSNDLIWGASAVNIFNYTFMQEYFANILGLEVGTYYHIANNLHYYVDRHQQRIEDLATIKDVINDSFCYKKNFHSLEEFDTQLHSLRCWECQLRMGKINTIENLNDDFFNDWAKVLYTKTTRKFVEFTNPILNRLIRSSPFTNDTSSN